MNNNRRRNFRGRQQKSNFLRRRNGSSNTSSFNNGNINFNRNADHYLRRLNELTEKKESYLDKNKISDNTTSEETLLEKKLS